MRFLPFLLLGLLVLAGCTSSSPVELEPVQRSSVQLDKGLVEKSALTENWETIRAHLRSVDEQNLSSNDKAYALFWMGVVQSKSGQKQSADYSYNCSPQLREMIEQARRSLKSYNRERPAATMPVSLGNWMLQFGLFSLRKSADECSTKLAWEGLNLQINEIKKDGKTLWIVWSGPYNGTEVTSLREKLEKKGLKFLVKNMSSPQF